MASATNPNPLLEHLEDGKMYDLDFGETWNTINDGNSSKCAYHTIKCNRNASLCSWKFRFFRLDDFKPASVVKSEQAELTVGSIQDVTITLPNIEVSSKGCHR